MDRVVVVGAGMAGARSVQELRAQGHTGRIVLIGAEPHLPYDRPPLSKEILRGGAGTSTLDVPWSELDVDLRPSTEAIALRPGVVETSTGEVEYDGLVLACGSRAVLPPGWGSGRVLRTLDDALALRAELVPGARVVVIGAGWIGAEVATAAAAAGCACTVVEAAPVPLAAALGDVGGLTVPWYAAAGVELRLSSPVTAVEPDAVVLAGGERLAADVVVVGVGAEPDVGWLRSSGLHLEGGVVVDEHLAASWPGVVAVGDCAAWWSRRYGTRLRVEHWDNALHTPTTAVTTLLGADAVHDPVPYFWSEQLGHRLQVVGHAPGAGTPVDRGRPGADDGWSVAWVEGDRLMGLLAVDRPRDLAQARRRITDGSPVDLTRLADPDVPLRSA